MFHSGISLRRMPPGRRYMRSCIGSSPSKKRSSALVAILECPELLKAVLASRPAYSNIISSPPGCCKTNYVLLAKAYFSNKLKIFVKFNKA